MQGFSLALKKNYSELDLESLSGNDDSCEFSIVKSNVLICSSVKNDNKFVDVGNLGDWLILSIGSCYGGGSLLNTLKIKCKFGNKKNELNDFLNALKSIYGQFCGVIFNYRTNDLIKVTDPSGCRSLFFGEYDGALIIASSLNMYRNLVPGRVVTPDIENQEFLMRYAYSLPGQTVYKDVLEMPVEKIVVSNLGDSSIEKSIYYGDENGVGDCAFELCSDISPLKDEYETELFERLKNACIQQVGDAKKIGVLLGGFDSALVVSILHRLGLDVQTYSFHYEQDSYNQPYVELLSATLGIKHHWVKIDSKVIEDGLINYSKSCNWPTLWLNYVIQTQYVCNRMVEDGIEVCFSGDGCDTAFLGYPSTHRRGQVYQRMPFIGEKLSSILISANHYLKLEYIFGHLSRIGVSLIDAATKKIEERALFSFQIFNSSSYQHLIGEGSKSYLSHQQYFEGISKNLNGLSYERKIYFTKSLISPNRNKIVSSSDVSGISIYSPYLHKLVTEFAKKLPDKALRPMDNAESGDGKYLLMKMAENSGLLPREIIYQPKIAAVRSPIDGWLSSDLNSLSKEMISRLPIPYNKSYINCLLKDLCAEKIYKKYFSKDGVVSLAPSLLITYASFFE